MTEMSQRKKPRFQILFYAKLHSAAVTHIRCKTSLALERHHVGAEASHLVRLLVRLLRNLNLSAEAIVKNYKLNISIFVKTVWITWVGIRVLRGLKFFVRSRKF